jgi:hypothetical protein
MHNNNPLYGYRKTPKIPTNTEFMAMSDEDIIAYCTEKEDNWKKVPRERIDDRVIAAMVQAHPKAVVALYSLKSDKHAEHVEAALLKWKSKALQRLRKADYPEDQKFVCALITEDPAYYRHLPREYKTPAFADAAIAADISMYEETPSTLITEHHILMVLEQAPELLSNRSKTPSCQLSPAVIEAIIEKAPDFFVSMAMQQQLSHEQIKRVANTSILFWNYCSIPQPEIFDLMIETLKNPAPGKGSKSLQRKIEGAKSMKPHEVVRALNGAGQLTPFYLMTLDILEPAIFSKHVKAFPKLMPYYQQIYGSEAAMALTNSPKIRRDILGLDIGL